MDTEKIDVTNISVKEAAELIAKSIKKLHTTNSKLLTEYKLHTTNS